MGGEHNWGYTGALELSLAKASERDEAHMPHSDRSRAEFTFSFLTLKLTAKGFVAVLLALPVALILTAIAWRIFHG